MKNNGERSLKSLNMKWLVLLAAADVLFVLLFVAPDPEVSPRIKKAQGVD
ncbi:TPA: hypothetical protein U2L45_004865 [Citrobacter freundii]|nr:hypothetical protein [Citrobacter freundii]